MMSDRALETLMEMIGWIGSFEILLAYGLNSYQKVKSDSLAFFAAEFDRRVVADHLHFL